MSILTVVETPSIKKYVFSTDKLMEIRGASALLDYLNRHELEAILKPGEKIYANGGSGQFVFEMSAAEVIEKLQQAQKAYVDVTAGGAFLVWGIAEFDTRESTSYMEAVRIAHADLERRRYGNPMIAIASGMPLVKLCDSCGHNPASEFSNYPEADWLCEVCSTKRKFTQSQGRALWHQFVLAMDLKEVQPVKTLADIKPRMAVIYADGNSMGKHVRSLASPEEYRLFSETVDNAVRQACFQGLLPIVREHLQNSEEGNHTIPADILLRGGDDLIVVLPATHALSFACTAAETFYQIVKDKLGRDITLSLGVIVGPPTYPLFLLLDLAEQLLRSAKEKASAVSGSNPPSSIDFHIISASNSLDLKTIRSEYGKDCEQYRRTKRPYTLEELKNLFAIKAYLDKNNFPKSRLNSLYEALFGTAKQAHYRAKKLLTSGGDAEREHLLHVLEMAGCADYIPWSSEKDTFITELVEFYDYLPSLPEGGVN